MLKPNRHNRVAFLSIMIGTVTGMISAMLIVSPSILSAQAKKAETRILFHQDSALLPQGADRKLNHIVSQWLKRKDSLRRKNPHQTRSYDPKITIIAFAALPEQPGWKAQRLALKRALVVEKYLLQKAVNRKYIILKPQGNLCASPCQRVDVVLNQ